MLQHTDNAIGPFDFHLTNPAVDFAEVMLSFAFEALAQPRVRNLDSGGTVIQRVEPPGGESVLGQRALSCAEHFLRVVFARSVVNLIENVEKLVGVGP